MTPVRPPPPRLVDSGELVVDGRARLVTESSVWIVTSGRYWRFPRTEGPREPTCGIEGRLDDLEAHEHRGGRWWWDSAAGAHRLQLHPTVGPADGQGVITGLVEKISGAQAPLDVGQRPSSSSSDRS